MTAKESAQRHLAHAPADDGLSRRSVRSGAFVMAGQAATMVIGLASTAVLARLLTPEDFGLVAMAAAVTALVAALQELGLADSTIQRAEITHAQVSTLFWINGATGGAAAILAIALAHPAALWYERPDLAPIVAALGAPSILTGFAAQHLALLRRRMRFDATALIAVISALVASAAAIVAALSGLGVWSLVLMPAVATACTLAGAWIAGGWRPGRPMRGVGVRPMIRFGSYLAGTTLIGTVVRNVDRILIGRFLGAETAGFYGNAQRIFLAPLAQLSGPLTTVALPALSRLQDDPDRFRRFYRAGLEAITMLTVPIAGAAIVLAEPLVLTLLGPQWHDSVPIFRALAPAGLLAALNVMTSWVYVPLGLVDRQFRWQLGRAVVVVTAFVVGLRWGALGVAIAYSAASYLVRIPAVIYCFRGTFVQLRDALAGIWRAGAATTLAALVAVVLDQALPATKPLVELVRGGAIFALAYAGAWLVLPGGPATLRRAAAWRRHLLPSDGPFALHRPVRRAIDAWRNRRATLHPAPVFILGNQKSGTTAIAALLGRLVDLPVSIDLPRELHAPTYPRVRRGEMSLDAFIRRNGLVFSRPIVKAPNLTFLHDRLAARYPASRFVMIVRDPRQNIRSILNRVGLRGDLDRIPDEAWAALPPGRRLLLDGRWLGCTADHYIGQLAERWNVCADVYLAAPDRFVLVRYEDFERDKIGVLRELAARLGLEACGAIEAELDVDYQPRGDRTVDPGDFFGPNLALIETLCRTRMVRLGYAEEA